MSDAFVPDLSYINSAVCAADVLLRHSMGLLTSMSYDIQNLIDATDAFHAIIWNRSIATKIGGNRIRDFMVRLRISRLPKEKYTALVSILSLGSCDESQICPH